MDLLPSDGLLDEEQAFAGADDLSANKIRSTVNATRYLAIGGLLINGLALTYAFLNLFSMMGVSPTQRYIGNRIIGTAIFVIIFLSANLGFCLLLYQYSSNLQRFLQEKNSQTLRDFFERQKVFWTVMGLAVIISLVLYLMSFLLLRWS